MRMNPVRRKVWVVALLNILFFTGLGCIGVGDFAEVGQKKCVGTLIFEAKKVEDFHLDGLQTIREVAKRSGKEFEIIPCREPVKWQWPPWRTVEAYREARRGLDSNLWELRVFDSDAEVAVNTANSVAVQTRDISEKEYNVLYEAWLKTLSPSRYRDETMGPHCFGYEGITIWEAASILKPKAAKFWDSLSRSLIDAVIW